MQIVEMEKKYLGSALDIYQWYVENSTATFQIENATLEEMNELLFFSDSRYRSWALLDNGIFAGYGIITQYKKRGAYTKTAEITVYLRQGSIGKGYGSLLVQHMERFAREQGLHVLIAIISGENELSFRLFERNGYLRCAHYHEVGHKFGRWIDLVCYEKKLDEVHDGINLRSE